MFRFLRSDPKEKTVRISVETVVKCLKLLRLRGHFDLVLNESTVNTLIRELNDFDPDESPDTVRRAKLLAKSLRQALDWEDLQKRSSASKKETTIRSGFTDFNGLIDDRYGGSY